MRNHRGPVAEPDPTTRWHPTRPLLRRLLWYRDRLRAAGGFTTAEAVAALEVTARTVYRDLATLDTLRWDVAFCRRRRRWVLSGERGAETPLPLIELREGELVALLAGEEALRRYAGTPYAAALRSAFEKLLPLLDAPVSLDLTQAPLPRFTGPPARAVDARQYERVVEACRRRVCLEITYHSLERDEVNVRRVDPYHVFAHGGDWYVVAFDHMRGDWRTFALGDRLRELRERDETFALDPAFDLDCYLAEGFGLFRSGPVEEVVLRFSPTVARYLRERVWDATEVEEPLPDGSLRLTLRVPINTGLLRFVLQYGGECAVEESPTLRRMVAAEVARLAETYAERDSS